MSDKEKLDLLLEATKPFVEGIEKLEDGTLVVKTGHILYNDYIKLGEVYKKVKET